MARRSQTITSFWISEVDYKEHHLEEVYGREKPDGGLKNLTAAGPALSYFNRPGRMFSGDGGVVADVLVGLWPPIRMLFIWIG